MTEISKFIVICKGIPFKGGQILIGRKRPDRPHPMAGKWHLCGGCMEHGETPEQCAEREISEETGLKTKATRILHTAIIDESAKLPAHFDKTPRLFLFYECRVIGGKEQPGDDVSELKWIKLEEAGKHLERKEDCAAIKNLKAKPLPQPS